jgi:hypothetical protein
VLSQNGLAHAQLSDDGNFCVFYQSQQLWCSNTSTGVHNSNYQATLQVRGSECLGQRRWLRIRFSSGLFPRDCSNFHTRAMETSASIPCRRVARRRRSGAT